MPPFQPQRLLVTTDFSAESKRALPLAAQLAERFGSEVDLLYVFEPPPRFAGTESLLLMPEPKAVREELEAGLVALARSVFPPSVKVTPHLRPGKPVPKILRAARELKADALIMATHGYSGLQHALLGSVTERVVRRAPCPVLAVRGDSRRGSKRTPPPDSVGHILLATDFSKNARTAFPQAVSLARLWGAELTLVYVVQRFPLDALLGTEVTRNTAAILSEQGKIELTELARSLSSTEGLKIGTQVCFGQPFQEITRIAEDLNVGLIVLATHGHTGIRHAYLGSVAERVVQHASCPVLVVPALKS